MALSALGISLILLGSGLWFVRYSIASFMLGAALSERGADADFQFVNLDLNSAALANVRFGSAETPDATIPLIEARWRWDGISPHIYFLRVVRPRLHFRMDERGRVSAGALARLGGGKPSRRRPSIPAIELEILEGQAVLDTPFGPLNATLQSSGAFGNNFSARATIAPTSRPGEAYALENGAAELVVVSRDSDVSFRLSASANALTWNNTRAATPAFRILGRVPLDLSRYDFELNSRAAAVRGKEMSARSVTAALSFEGIARATELAPETWASEAHGTAGDLRLGESSIEHARFDGRVEGDDVRGQGRWSLSGERFNGFALISEQPSASGVFRFELQGDNSLIGEARVTLAQAHLTDRARQHLRSAFPDIPDAPIGPTFAQAEHALDAAANRFDLSIPLTINVAETGIRLQVAAPAEARAASGARLQLAPLRRDGPALVLQWPGPSLSGAVALELSGGGAPNASLLLDTLDWTPNAPFETDGTLTLTNWHTDNASIATDELGVTIAIRPQGGGSVDLRGPAQITGPIGDGEVRNLVASLDLGVRWGNGWRVTPNSGCVPIRLGGIDAAGLSFANGALSLCPLGGALIAADAARNLSGGFSVRDLALNGRMSGPEGQPAHLSASNVAGRFRGRAGDFTLAIEAHSPRLTIEMAEQRALAVRLERLTADARIADGWTVTGSFNAGTLDDPALPGSISAIEGAWSAQPEDGKPVIQVRAGEALLTANRPATDDDRPLFNPLRIADASATLQNGEITASGAIVLDAGHRQLARFNARHDVSEGVGMASVSAERIEFGPDLQPYEITEQARGLVEGVRGPIAASADITWTRNNLLGTGLVRLDGLSLSTATIPILNDVRGEVRFDNLWELTTPPGQHITIGELNPGVAVSNGRVSFQLLRDAQVVIERADFDFASGTLSMLPTTISLGADETHFELGLKDVDAGDLLRALGVPDLTATGKLEGEFPLLLTRRSAFVDHGVIRAQGEGGVISYTGQAGANATGVSRMAFDALRSFQYDTLSLTLDGDLNGDVVSSIEFSGHNSGRPVDLGAITPVPGVGHVTVRGVPFDFNVHVTAPFRRLAQTAATITDPSVLINQSRRDETEEPVDLDASPPR
ncbi:MAG: YdbH domain-containing protein [Hyphomonadaceae bacterium]|nr:YdbH domain-containing protein [Hyphomonadaceae bacterium]